MTRDKVIANLRELADLLERKPDFPVPGYLDIDNPSLRRWVYRKEELFGLAAEMGSFSKRFAGDKFELVVTLPSGLELIYYCDRDQVCKRVRAYAFEDAESILVEIPAAEAEAVELS